MNCKPNDIAIIIGGNPANRGAHVRLTEHDGVCWFFENASRPLVFEQFQIDFSLALDDEDLVPVPVAVLAKFDRLSP